MIVSTTKYYPNALSTTNRVFPHFLVLSVVNLFNHSSNKYASKRNISVDKTSFFDFFSEPNKNLIHSLCLSDAQLWAMACQFARASRLGLGGRPKV